MCVLFTNEEISGLEYFCNLLLIFFFFFFNKCSADFNEHRKTDLLERHAGKTKNKDVF